MNQVIRVVKAVPWSGIGRLSLKLICLLGVAILAVLVIIGKAIKLYFAMQAMEESKPNSDEELFCIGSSPHSPELDPFRPS